VALIRARLPGRPALVPDTPLELADAVGIELDDWQAEYLECEAPRRLLNASRQSGKSTVAALDGLHDALSVPGSLVLIIAPSERQSLETFRKVGEFYNRLGHSVPADSERKLGMELLNGSRIEGLPGSEKTIRGFSAPRRVIMDEASRIEDETFTAVLPMLAIGGGAMDLLSTPAGKRGFFYNAAESAIAEWERWTIPATEVPRITPEFLAEQRHLMGERWFLQEFMCEFLDTDDAVFATDLIENASGYEVAATGGFEW
jgi:phage FluMu gp28-like protein